MPNLESRPIATSIRVDHEHTLEMRADMASKTAEVENVTTGEMYTGGGGGEYETIEVTIFFVEVNDDLIYQKMVPTSTIIMGAVTPEAIPILFAETDASGKVTAPLLAREGVAYINATDTELLAPGNEITNLPEGILSTLEASEVMGLYTITNGGTIIAYKFGESPI